MVIWAYKSQGRCLEFMESANGLTLMSLSLKFEARPKTREILVNRVETIENMSLTLGNFRCVIVIG